MKKRQCSIPFLTIEGITLLPYMVIGLKLISQKEINAAEEAVRLEKKLFVITRLEEEEDTASLQDLSPIGVLFQIHKMIRTPDNKMHLVGEGVSRGLPLQMTSENGVPYMSVSEILQDSEDPPSTKTKALMKETVARFFKYVKNDPATVEDSNLLNIINAEFPGKLSDCIASCIPFTFAQRMVVLNLEEPEDRLKIVYQLLSEEVAIMSLRSRIKQKTELSFEQKQKEQFLREELLIIQKELGEENERAKEIAAYKKTLLKSNPPPFVVDAMEKEFSKLNKMSTHYPEYAMTQQYIEEVLSLPWNAFSKEISDIAQVKKTLDRDHYGLQQIKDRILEYIAVHIHSPQSTSPILCLVGPPGVGKTSIAASIAEALGRQYAKVSLGGIKDESDIRGHRRTYIGAMPGRILYALKRAAKKNPVLLLDEIDKIGASNQGNPASALLEVLDPEQNMAFRDHYIGLEFDLSQVLFICTANTTENIPKPLLDRMEILSLSSYTMEDKLPIATQYLLPNALRKCSLRKTQLSITSQALEMIIKCYTREAGVRQLDRELNHICRKAVFLKLSEKVGKQVITESNLSNYIGKPKIAPTLIEKEPQTGLVCGLAWTPTGGCILLVEATVMPGRGKVTLTGNLGNIMKESVSAALCYIRAHSDTYCIEEEFHRKTDIHIHIPENAIKKDGPSAGITMACAMLSALSGAKIKNDVAMTGEITIRGEILPIGGLKEKAIAAQLAGIKTLILPKGNEPDIADIPESVQQELSFVPVSNIKEMFTHAVVKGETVWK